MVKINIQVNIRYCKRTYKNDKSILNLYTKNGNIKIKNR